MKGDWTGSRATLNTRTTTTPFHLFVDSFPLVHLINNSGTKYPNSQLGTLSVIGSVILHRLPDYICSCYVPTSS